MNTPKFKIESGVQLLARLSKKTGLENFYPTLLECGLKHGDTVEIMSSGNTSYLLIDLICEALFPSKPNEPAGVLMLNTMGRFNYEQLIEVLQKRIYSSLENEIISKMCKTEMDMILQRTMRNFFLLEIEDATQFYTTVHNFDNIFMQHSNVSLLIIDTLVAFYWSEQGFKITKMDLYAKNLLKIIQKVSKEYKVILIYTRPGYFNSSKDINNLETSDITDDVNLRIQLVYKTKGVYQVNVKTLDTYYKKYFSIIDNVIKWQ